MAQDSPLSDLRDRIDSLDDAILRALAERTALAEEIGRRKVRHGPAYRPGREADVLRRLAGQDRDRFPLPAMVRLWREIFSVMSNLQGGLSLAVLAEPAGRDLRPLARAHFGTLTPVAGYETCSGVLRALVDGRANLAVLPLPRLAEEERWWAALAEDAQGLPRIVAGLPAVIADAQRGAEALVLSMIDRDPAEPEHSFLVLEPRLELSRATLVELLADVGLTAVRMQAHLAERRFMQLAEVEGVVTADDPRLAELLNSDEPELTKVWALGGYALPLVAEREHRRALLEAAE